MTSSKKSVKRAKLQYRLCLPNEPTLDCACGLFEKEKRGKLLDIGAGIGYLSERFKSAGFDVFACDLEPKHFKPKDIPIKRANLEKKLPYPDSFFDYVACSEVLEHLENPWHACREISRVLKPGGKVVITLPNSSNLISRWLFFVRGNYRQFGEWFWDNWGHINPITYLELKRILEKSNLKIEKVETAEKIDQPYGLILRLVQKTASEIFHILKIIKMGYDRKDKSLSVLETEPLLFGESLIIKCQKRSKSR